MDDEKIARYLVMQDYDKGLMIVDLHLENFRSVASCADKKRKRLTTMSAYRFDFPIETCP